MSVCQIEERDAGRSYPRTCPTCKLTGPCAKGLDRKGLADRIEALEAKLAKAVLALENIECEIMVDDEGSAGPSDAAREARATLAQIKGETDE